MEKIKKLVMTFVHNFIFPKLTLSLININVELNISKLSILEFVGANPKIITLISFILITIIGLLAFTVLLVFLLRCFLILIN